MVNSFYQGYNIHDIAEKVSYEEVVFLLWNAHLPTKDELSTFRSELVAGMRIPSQVVEMIKLTPPTSHPMSILRTAVSMLSIYDPDTEDIGSYGNLRKAMRLVAQIPTIIADLYRVRKRQPLLSPDPNFGIAANFLYMLRGTPPDELEQKVIDLVMVLHADHGFNASTFTARVISKYFE